MHPRIAIPIPHSTNHEYSERAIPQYERAVELAGGEPVRIPLDRSGPQVSAMIANCSGVLLPGSNADVDPARFQQQKSPSTANADLEREAVDNLLLEDAYAHKKPVLGICYGVQSLNVFRKGSLIQHIPNSLAEDLRTKVNHEAGKKIAVAHRVEIEPASKLFKIVTTHSPKYEIRYPLIVPVNSSHHQSVERAGEGLRIVARCPDDGIIEALEGTARDHFVVAVQWHPERSTNDPVSRNIFRALIEATSEKSGRPGE